MTKVMTLITALIFTITAQAAGPTCYEQLDTRIRNNKNPVTDFLFNRHRGAGEAYGYAGGLLGVPATTSAVGVALAATIGTTAAVVSGFGIGIAAFMSPFIAGEIVRGVENIDEKRMKKIIEDAMIVSTSKGIVQKKRISRLYKKVVNIIGSNGQSVLDFADEIVKQNESGKLCGHLTNIKGFKRMARIGALDLDGLAVNQEIAFEDYKNSGEYKRAERKRTRRAKRRARRTASRQQ